MGPSTGDFLKSGRPSYTHEAMIDLIVERPMVSQGDIAEHFGYTESHISLLLRSDAMRELLAKRKIDILGPVFEEIQKRFEALAHRSIDILTEALDTKKNPEVALKALEITSRAMGYGAKQAGVTVNQQFIAYMPQKSENGAEWAAEHRPPTAGRGVTATYPVDSPGRSVADYGGVTATHLQPITVDTVL